LSRWSRAGLFRANHPSRVTVLRARRRAVTGLPTDSVVRTDNLATVSDAAIGRVIGILPMAGVDAALRVTLDL
jgi:mRNA-degrading endonuclease toxin of MazEF toxin-antitoxin module